MLTTPTKETVLLSIARFLEREVRPHISDAKTNYHLLVSTALLVSTTSELAFEDEHLKAEFTRLENALGSSDAGSNVESQSAAHLRAAIAKLEAAAITRVREDESFASAIIPHVKQTLLAEISTQNPRFSFDADIEPKG